MPLLRDAQNVLLLPPCLDNSPTTAKIDIMVQAVRQRGPDHGFYGARVSGGGSGGTVVVLLEAAALPELERLATSLSLNGIKPTRLVV